MILQEDDMWKHLFSDFPERPSIHLWNIQEAGVQGTRVLYIQFPHHPVHNNHGQYWVHSFLLTLINFVKTSIDHKHDNSKSLVLCGKNYFSSSLVYTAHGQVSQGEGREECTHGCETEVRNAPAFEHFCGGEFPWHLQNGCLLLSIWWGPEFNHV